MRKTESFQPSQGTIIGFIDILDEMHIEMDIVIHSFPSNWASIIHCTPGENSVRLPGVFIHANSATTMGFYPVFSNDGDRNYFKQTSDALVIGETYHFEMDITQSTYKVTVNGVVKADDVVQPHNTYMLENITCYASNPWWDAANVTISNLFITGIVSFILLYLWGGPGMCTYSFVTFSGNDILSSIEMPSLTPSPNPIQST